MPATKPQVFVFPNGDKITLYYIGLVAKLLCVKPDTVRKWEYWGYIPSTGFRDKFNRRLYSKEQIDALVASAEKCRRRKLKKDGTFVVKSFAYEATMAFKKIQEEYSKKGVKTSEKTE